jgi:predicted small lipoprotein YifL
MLVCRLPQLAAQDEFRGCSGMVAAIQETTLNRHIPVRLSLIAALAAALLVAGCGRKGPLDLPPVSANSPPAAAEPAPQPGAGPTAQQQTGYDEFGRPVAPRGTRQRSILDVLID